MVSSGSQQAELAPAPPALLPTALRLDEVGSYAVDPFDRTQILRLDVNEDPRGAPAHLVAAAQQSLTAHGLATYPPPQALQAALGHLSGRAADEVLLCNGGDQGLELLLRAYLQPGATLLTHAPGFDMFPLWAGLRGCPTRALPLRRRSPAHFEFDVAAFLGAIDELGPALGAVALVTPNNPTGHAIPRADVLAVAERLQRRARTLPAVPLIVDETYIDFGGETVADLVGTLPFLFVQRSLSKSAALAGVRLGYVLGPAPEIARLLRAAEPFRINRLALEVGLRACLNIDGSRPKPATLPDWWRARVQETLACRDQLAAGLRAFGLGVGAEDSNFLLVDVGDRHATLTEALRQDGIWIRDRDGKHPLLAGCVRIGIGDEGQVARTLCAIRRALEGPPPLQAVLFDMDGTLVDVRSSCLWAIAETVRALLREAGRDDAAAEIDAAAVDAWKAKGGLNNDWDCERAMLASYGVAPTYDAIVARHQALYAQAIDGEPWLLDRGQLSAVTAAGLPLGLCTGRPRAEALYTLARADAPIRFVGETEARIQGSGPDRDALPCASVGVVVGLEDMTRQKPAPDGLLQACAALGVAPAATAYIGDSVDDMRAAVEAGCVAVGVLAPGAAWNDGTAERLALAGASVVCRDVKEALQWLVT